MLPSFLPVSPIVLRLKVQTPSGGLDIRVEAEVEVSENVRKSPPRVVEDQTSTVKEEKILMAKVAPCKKCGGVASEFVMD